MLHPWCLAAYSPAIMRLKFGKLYVYTWTLVDVNECIPILVNARIIRNSNGYITQPYYAVYTHTEHHQCTKRID